MAEAGVIEIPVRPDVRDFGRDLGRQLGREVAAARGDLSTGMTKLADVGKTAFSAITQGALLLGAAGTVAVAGFGKSVFDAALDIDRIESKSRIVFGASAGYVADWATTNSRALMLTRGEAQQVATTLGDLLIPMGFLPEAAAKLATEATATAAALARWDSQSRGVGNAQDALADALLGEFERLKEYGVVLDATTLDELVRAKGLDGLTGAARRQAEAEIIMAEVNRQSAAAITSLSDSELTLADRTDMAKLAVARFRDDMAERLLPTLQRFLDWLNENSEDIQNYLTSGMITAARFIRDDLIPAFNMLRDWWTGPDGAAFRAAVSQAFTGVKVDAQGAKGSVESFSTSLISLANSATRAIEFGNQVSGALNTVNAAVTRNGQETRQFVILTVQAWSEVARRTIDSIGQVMGYLSALPGRAAGAVGDLGRTLFDAGRRLISGFLDGIKAAASGIGAAVGGAVSSAVRGIGDGWGEELGPGSFPGGGNVRIGGRLPPVGMGAARSILGIAERAGVQGTASSIWRPGSITNSGNLSRHASGNAVDFVGPSLMRIAQQLMATGTKWGELIYTPLGFSVKNGRRVAPFAQADHYDHVHAALAGGAVFNRPTVLDRTLVAETARARPEIMTPQSLMADTFSAVLDSRESGPRVVQNFSIAATDPYEVARRSQFAMAMAG